MKYNNNKYLVIFDHDFRFSFFYQTRLTYQHFVSTISRPVRCNNIFIFYGDFSDKIPSFANLMKTPLSKVAFLNDQNTFLVVKYLRLPFRSVGSGWQWISEGINCVRFLFKVLT